MSANSSKITLNIGLSLLGLFIAIGFIVGGYFIGQTLYNAKVAINTAEAKGLAERRVKADVAEWQIQYSVSSDSNDNMKALYDRSKNNQENIIELLKTLGFADVDINIGGVNYRYQEYRNNQQELVDQKYILDGQISVETNKVDLVSKARSEINALIAQGIQVRNFDPKYRFTQLNEIKPAMLREATQNAKLAASEFAVSAGTKVGQIREARQGAFIIRDVGEDYGDTRKMHKDVRVVTTIEFYLVN